MTFDPDRGPHQHDHVHSGLNEQVQSVLVVLPGAYGCTTQQLLARVLGGQRVVTVLLQVSASDDGHQLVIVIHYGQLPCRQEDRGLGVMA